VLTVLPSGCFSVFVAGGFSGAKLAASADVSNFLPPFSGAKPTVTRSLLGASALPAERRLTVTSC
jgi:hypothetical protein